MKEMSNMIGKTQCKKPRLNGKAKAKRLSEESYDTAYREYQKKGEILFSEGMRNGKQYGEELIERVKKITRSFVKEEKVSPAAFLYDDYYAIVTALKLPAALHYNDFEYVGKGGDYDNGQFVRVEEWCCCELTCLREGIIHALADLCLQGATCAKKNSSINAKDAFINAYISIMCGCIKPDISEANLSKEEAEGVQKSIFTGIKSLWGEFQILDNQKVSQDKKILDDDFANIKPGRYGSSVISNVDSKEGIITFVGEYGKKGESFKIPPKANKLWAFLKLLIETESEDGSTTITNDFKTWNGLFDRKETKFGGQETKRRKEELQRLKRHIKSCKGPGRRGLPMLKIVAKVSRSRAKKTD